MSNTLYNIIQVTNNGTKINFSNQENRTCAGTDVVIQYLEIGTNEEALDLSALDSSGQIVIKNNDSTNFLEVGFATGVYPIRILKTGAAFIPLNPATETIYLKADTAPAMVTVYAQEV